MKFFPRAFLVLFISGWCQVLPAQASDSSEIIMVTADVIARDKSEALLYPNYKGETYFITIDLTNTQDTMVKVTIMSCSWDRNFTVDLDSLFLRPIMCDADVVTTIEIPAHSSVKFYATLVNYKKMAPGKWRSFKIGFVDIPNKDLWHFTDRLSKQAKTKYKTYWSKNIDLIQKLNSYENPDKKRIN